MSRKDRITAALTEAFSPASLEVIDESHLHAGHSGAREGGESHYRVRIVADAFSGKTRLARHRAVNEVLKSELVDGGIHALAIDAKAPADLVSL